MLAPPALSCVAGDVAHDDLGGVGASPRQLLCDPWVNPRVATPWGAFGVSPMGAFSEILLGHGTNLPQVLGVSCHM